MTEKLNIFKFWKDVYEVQPVYKLKSQRKLPEVKPHPLVGNLPTRRINLAIRIKNALVRNLRKK